MGRRPARTGPYSHRRDAGPRRRNTGAARLRQEALRSACIRIEERYGLRATAPADGPAVLGPSRAEIEKARRTGRNESVRETLRRHVRTAAAGRVYRSRFLAQARRRGCAGPASDERTEPRRDHRLLRRVGKRTSGPVGSGKNQERRPLFFSGGKLAPELSLPKLRSRWAGETVPLGDLKLGEADRQALWRSAIDGVVDAERDVRKLTTAGTLDEAADAAAGAIDVLASAANVLERQRIGPLHRAGRQYERAVRERCGRRVARTSHGNRLRLAAVMIGGLRGARGSKVHHAAVLIRCLPRLIDAVQGLRAAQQRLDQAAAARRACAELDAAHANRTEPHGAAPRLIGEREPRARRRHSHHHTGAAG